MSFLQKRRQEIPSLDYSAYEEENNLRKQQKREEQEKKKEINALLPQITFSAISANQQIITKAKQFREEIQKCVSQKNYKSIPRLLRKKLGGILLADSSKKIIEVFQETMSIIVSCIALQPITNNYFLQKSFCDHLEEIMNYYNEYVDNQCIDILFNLFSALEGSGIKEYLLEIIIRICKKNIQKCKRSIQENQDNTEINSLSVKMKFKFIKLLYRIISDEIPENELQSNQKTTLSAYQNLNNSASAAVGGVQSPTQTYSSATKNNLIHGKPVKSFQSQLIAEMVRWLQQEPLISSKVLRFLLNIESRQATIVKLCLLKNINLNEDSQLYFLEFLKKLFQDNGEQQNEIILKVFQYLNNCIRSLSFQVRLKASQIFHHFPYFDHSLLLRTIKLEQFQDYGKSTPTKSALTNNSNNNNNPNNNNPNNNNNNVVVTPTKSDQEKFSISHGYGSIVHLLEDEFNEVRKSALQIIQNFGEQNEIFGKESRDLLFCMLNDENDSVRIKAIESIRTVLAQEQCEMADGSKKKLVNITNEEMDNLMFNLKERVPRLRIVIYQLLGKVKLESLQQLNMILDITLRNINEFTDDSYIYEMCRNIGQHNGNLIQKNICQILQIADILYVQEPHWKDKAHIYRVIMIANSFLNRDHLQSLSDSLLPSYFLKQYDMMQDLMPSYFHPLYSHEQSQLSALKSIEIGGKKKNDKNEDEDKDKIIEELEDDKENNRSTKKNNDKLELEDNKSREQSSKKINNSIDSQQNIQKQSSSRELLKLLTKSLSEINKKKKIFKVINDSAKRQQEVSGIEQDELQFIKKISKIGYLINVITQLASKRNQLQSLNVFSTDQLKYQLSKILNKMHKVQQSFIVDEEHERMIERLILVTLIHLPLLHMPIQHIYFNNPSSSINQSTHSFESITFINTLTFLQDIIRSFSSLNSNKLTATSQSININNNSNASTTMSTLPFITHHAFINPFALLHQSLEECNKIARDVQANIANLNIPSNREIYFSRYKNFLNSFPYKLLFGKKDSNNLQNINIKLRKGRIFLPKDESVEIQSKYMAKTGFVAEICNFSSVKERKNLQLVVEYSDSSMECMQLIEDDFIQLSEDTHVINTNIFFQKINWTSESLATIYLKYLSPLTIFNKKIVTKDILQLYPSNSLLSSSSQSTVSNNSNNNNNDNNNININIPTINPLTFSVVLAKSKPFNLVIKSRVF